MWTLGTRNRRYNCTHVEGKSVCIDRCVVVAAPETVLFCIGFDQCDAVFVTTRCAQITQCLVVDREEATCCAILRRHVGDCRTVCQWKRIETLAVEFYELPNNAFFTQHFNNLKDEVRTGRAFHHRACQLKPYDFRDKHRDRLAEHRRFRLDPANAPTQNSCAVHHSRVAVCPNERVRVGNLFTVLVLVGPNRLAKVLKVYLVTNACARRNNAEI